MEVKLMRIRMDGRQEPRTEQSMKQEQTIMGVIRTIRMIPISTLKKIKSELDNLTIEV